MKTIPIQEAEGKLGELIAEACRGEVIVLKDGDRVVTLEPGIGLDLDLDSRELEAELLKAASGPFSPYSKEEMRIMCDKGTRESPH